jgi:hypothetical protein
MTITTIPGIEVREAGVAIGDFWVMPELAGVHLMVGNVEHITSGDFFPDVFGKTVSIEEAMALGTALIEAARAMQSVRATLAAVIQAAQEEAAND